jgi:hypothetical protein
MVIASHPLTGFESDNMPLPVNDDPAIALVTLALKKFFCITGI